MAYTLDYYKNWLQNTIAEINERKRKNSQILEDVELLERAYNTIGNLKRYNSVNAKDVQKNATKVASNVAWRSKAKNDFDGILDDSVKSAAKEFYNSIDDMHDELSQAIAQKRGELDSGSFIINSLNKSKEWIEGVIRGWVN